MNIFTKKVMETVKSVPFGKVATYGQIAALAGSPRSARQVARILHSLSRKYGLPWHRIVNAQGKIVLRDPDGSAEQAILLESEHVQVRGNKVDLSVYGWSPEAH